MSDAEHMKAPIEYRAAGDVAEVNFAQRLITLVAVPYEEPAEVMYRGEMWKELFERGSFDGIEKRPNRVRVNRDHNRSRTVGKSMKFFPSRTEGLVSEIRIAQTVLGDETLSLADEDMLSASVGYGVRGSGQVLERRSMTRRIKQAFLDHIAMVESPAFVGAQVLDVRSPSDLPTPTEKLVTPELDQFIADDVLQWASERLKK